MLTAFFPFGAVQAAVTYYDTCEISYLIVNFGYWRGCSLCRYAIILCFMPHMGLAKQFRNNLRVHCVLEVSILRI